MMGILLKQTGDLDGAIPELKEAIRLDPDTPGPTIPWGKFCASKEINRQVRKCSQRGRA